MKIDVPLLSQDLGEVAGEARRLEQLGYAGVFTFDGPHDPFFPLLIAAGATERVELATAIAVAFARNPMTLAQLGYDLQTISRGRLILGLGSQIRPHIERRFSMPWSRPAARMREFVLALRAIWRCWQEGEPLDFRGEFYTHTLMTPLFRPAHSEFGTPRVFLAGVGPRMTEVAGEVADGFLVHPLHTPRFIRETTLPALERGLARSGRSLADLEISCQLLVASGETEERMAQARAMVRTQLAFYASTRAYRPVLDCHGWGDLQSELHPLSRQGRWAQMSELVSDEILETIAVCAAPDELADRIRARCAGFAQRVSPLAPDRPDPARWAQLSEALTGS